MARPGMKAGPLASLVAGLVLLPALPAQALQHHLLVITGLGGTDAFRQQFARAGTNLVQAALDAGIDRRNIILLMAEAPADSPASSAAGQRPANRQSIERALVEISAAAGVEDRVFVVLIGHGNARGDSAVFNLPGPDISAEDLADAVSVLGDRPTVIINTASASGPFIRPLSRENRVVITATSSGREYHAPLFGDHLVAAFASAGADRDKDERISVLEAFDYARREVRRSFDSDKRLLTEHALLDDNGDGEGSLDPGEFQPDGSLAHRLYLQPPRSLSTGASDKLLAMLQSKQRLEQSIAELKRRRDSMLHENYYAELENLLVELALLARDIRAEGG